ncbi:glycosyltransferase [Amaricoccus sp. HAR-UPW-R2A-40]|nr:glycosyltransferase [Amaricoccus sp. HAR-UPW-R2A-40]
MVEDCMAARLGRVLKPKVLIASNGSVIARYHSDAQFRRNVDQADLVDADGMPLVLASRFFCGAPLVERIATTDFIEDAAAAAAKAGLRFYFLGGKPGVAQKAARKLTERYPGLQIVGTRHGYFSASEEGAIIADILAKKADVLWLGLGSPHQEAFAIRLRDELPGVGWIRTCGGLFDHVSGAVPRATKRMQSMGLEWLHRLLVEPRRLAWRYITTNPVACFHLLTKTFEWAEPSVGAPVDALGILVG